MKKRKSMKTFLAILLTFAMIMSNSTVTAFADIIGSVTQEKKEETENTKRTYKYSDGNVSVTATLSSVDAVPDDAEFVVTQLSGAIHDTYMEALNQNADTIAANSSQEEAVEYTDDNTLLYDMAFMVDATDEDGNVIEGKKVEYQPAEGTVSLSVKFRQAQLSDELEAETADDITVIHMPLDEGVKEAADSTLEANASVSDIQVEVVDSNVSLGSSADSVNMSVDGFSVFVFNNNGEGQKNTWSGNSSFSMSDIISGLGETANYAVAAKTYTSGDHVEGNIYVGTFNVLGGGAVLNEGDRVYRLNTLSKINVSKTVTNGKDGTFNFAFFSEEKQVGPTFFITTENLSGTISIACGDTAYKAVFEALDKGGTLYLYELDENENPVKQGGKNGDYTVNYSYSSGNGIKLEEIENTPYSNYIGEFKCTSKIEVALNSFFKLGKIYVGSEPHTVDGEPGNYIFLNGENTFCVQNTSINNFTYVANLKETVSQNIDAVNSLVVRLADAKNGDTDKNGGSLNVINVVSTAGNLQSDLQNANFTSNYIKGLVDSGEGLLVNIDATAYASSYSMNGQEIKYDGVNPGNEYNYLGSHVVYNFVVKNADGSYSPYTGTIKINGNNSGAVIAPSAYVDQTGGLLQGTIVASSVSHAGQEIHKTPLVEGKEYEVNVACGNIGPATTTETTTGSTTESTTTTTTESTTTTTEATTTSTTEDTTTTTTKATTTTTEATTTSTTEDTTTTTTKVTTTEAPTTTTTKETTTERTTEATTEATTATTTEATTEATTEETSTTTTEESTTESTTETTDESTTDTTETDTETTTDTTVTETETETTTEATNSSVSITKGLKLMSGEDIRARDSVFYVALYEDPECTKRVSDVQALSYVNASSSNVDFGNLEPGKTYYVGECEADGTVLVSSVTADGTAYAPNFSNNTITVTENGTDTIYFDNEFADLPDGYDRIGHLTVTKKLVSSTGEAVNSDAVFYAGVFADAAHTQLFDADQITQNIIPLNMSGGSETSITLDVAMPESGSVTLYVTETDANGTPVEGAADFQYDVTVEGAEVSISEENLDAYVTITNTQKTEVTPTPSTSTAPTPTPTTGVKTGDDTPIALYALLLVAAAACASALIYYKRKQR